MLLGISTACSNYSAPNTSQSPPPPSVQSNDITIVPGASHLAGTAFSPNPKAISLGGNASVSVRWVNQDITGGDYTNATSTSHNITSDDGSFSGSGLFGGNRTYSVTLTRGSHTYHCSVHPNMVGTITVNP